MFMDVTFVTPAWEDDGHRTNTSASPSSRPRSSSCIIHLELNAADDIVSGWEWLLGLKKDHPDYFWDQDGKPINSYVSLSGINLNEVRGLSINANASSDANFNNRGRHNTIPLLRASSTKGQPALQQQPRVRAYGRKRERCNVQI